MESVNIGLQLKKLIADLELLGKEGEFIGYGNPDADILIIGKECALEEDSDDYKSFYKPNYWHWKESFEGHGFSYKNGDKQYSFENNAFHPIYPFYLQKNTTSKNILGHTSNTYSYYQMLIDKIKAEINGCEYTKSKNITFFRDCFITELNDICMRNHKDTTRKKEEIVEEHIRNRFEWMRKTSFFNQFKVVVLACGPYAGAIKIDSILKHDLFGDAAVFYCNQLSQWDPKLENEKDNIIKKIASLSPKISTSYDK